jgi:hypothetical protein
MAEPKRIFVGDMVQFHYGPRVIQGTVRENRGPIGVRGRVLYTVTFRPEEQSPYESSIELPEQQLELIPNRAPDV